jgi:beta-lactam-binding protein with PASTA domain
MKESMGLLAAVIGLATAVLVLLGTLNKSGTVEVPVIREVSILQPSDGGTTTEPTPTEPTEPTIETVSVPDVVGDSREDAEKKLAEEGLLVQGVDPRAPELCQAEGHGSGTVVATLPPAGAELSEGEGVRLTVCE